MLVVASVWLFKTKQRNKLLSKTKVESFRGFPQAHRARLKSFKGNSCATHTHTPSPTNREKYMRNNKKKMKASGGKRGGECFKDIPLE